MSEDRTQAPSPRRRQEARQRGQVAQSPGLTAAVGLLAAVVLLGSFGGELAGALIEAVRAPLINPAMTAIEPEAVVGRLRAEALRVARPLGMVVGGVVAALIAAHLAQTGGLWAPARLAPDPARLWRGWGGGGRGVWGLARVLAIVGVAAWLLRSDLPAAGRLGLLEVPELARAAGGLLRAAAYALALAMLVLGLVDFGLQWQAVEAMLRLTPEEHREDQRAVDGDPALRARRRRVAQGLTRVDSRQALAGACLILSGPGGTLVVLGGDGPPGPVLVRAIVRGPAAVPLRRAADRAGLPRFNDHDLARHFARGAAAGRTLTPELADRLATLWPVARPDS